ncbi:amino acid ABC transporter ATP-binding/permease protein [Niveispirillum sp.]|uniref:amino acid ABC transporter ATP-binding/permease protein n=1 Tax=Niveispirillum sp. TaxID=1917217 RepID=UPI001B51436C|nr:ATP-binding cassette domain-containing protein [Niveispirillum sp.]MBP7337286.1 ATP-binding cassette domain-containing protein [Niveispirillum sp.]
MRAHLLLLLRLFRQAAGRKLGWGLAIAGTTALAGAGLLGLSGWFITATGIAGLSAGAALVFDVFRPGAGVRALAILRTGARYGERLVTHDATLSVIAGLRVRLFRAMARPGLGRAMTLRPGRLLFRISGDLDALDTLYLRLLVPASVLLVLALAGMVGLALLTGWAGLLPGLFLLLTGIGMLILGGRGGMAAGGLRAAALEALRLRLLDLVAGRVDWRLAGRQAQAEGLALSAEARLVRADDRLNRLDSRLALWQGLAGTALLSGGVMLCAALVERGLFGGPAVALFVLVLLGMMEPLGALRRGAVELGRSLRAVRRVGDALSTPTGEMRPDGKTTDLVLSDIRFGHEGTLTPLFDGFNLSIPAGQHVAIIGDSGAGKSSLLAMLTGEAAPQAGTICLPGWALLGQEAALFQDSVRANLLLADPTATDIRLWEVLDQAGLARVVRDMPGGLDAPLGEGGTGLSSGQRRRLALARFLLQDKPLWLLDEVTEGIDLSVAAMILTKIKASAARRTILLVTHLRREAALADRIIRLSRGRVVMDVARGDPAFDQALSTLRPD